MFSELQTFASRTDLDLSTPKTAPKETESRLLDPKRNAWLIRSGQGPKDMCLMVGVLWEMAHPSIQRAVSFIHPLLQRAVSSPHHVSL